VREFLSVNSVPFEDRNIRRSEAARTELAARTGDLVVPQLFWRDTHIVGFDADALERLAAEYHGHRQPVAPPGNSLDASQEGKVAESGDSLADGLVALLARVREEIAFNEAKGDGSYRLGMHDALRFADDAIVDLLRSHGRDVAQSPRAPDA
jgi:glutaredoxin